MPALDERERQAFPLEWDNALDRLILVVTMMRDGELSGTEIAALRDVAQELNSLQPTLERLRLRQPEAKLLASVLDPQAA